MIFRLKCDLEIEVIKMILQKANKFAVKNISILNFSFQLQFSK